MIFRKLIGNLTETIHLLQSLTLKRIVNLLFNESSYLVSRLLSRPVMAGLPWSVSIEPTTACNLHCPECPSGLRKFTRPTGTLSPESFKSYIDQLSPTLIYLTLYFQGEPMLNKHFMDMVTYARKKKIYVSTSTNGHFLDDENARQLVLSGLDRLIISLDGLDQATYEKYRQGGELSKVLEGISNITRWKKELRSSRPFIEIQFLVLSINEHQINDIRQYANSTGADRLSLKSAMITGDSNADLLPTNERYRRYSRDLSSNLRIRSRLPDRCRRLWHSAVITWDGRVLPCCFDKDARYGMGNMDTDPFRRIWKNQDYSRFRKKVFGSRASIPICTNCSEGLKRYRT